MNQQINPQPLNHKTDPHSDVELEKLRLEIAELKWRVRWVNRVGQIISIFSVLGAGVVFVFSLYQYNSQQKENAKNSAEAFEREFKKPVWDKELALVFEISNVASTIAAPATDPEDRKKAESKFWQLFYGPVIFAEGRIDEQNKKEEADLRNEMFKFARCLQGISDECDSSHTDEERTIQLQKLSLDLTYKCREAMGQIYRVKFENYQPESAPTVLP